MGVKYVTKITHLCSRYYYRFSPPCPAYVNLGSGDKYVDKMINIDGNIFAHKDIWLDLRNGLPFPDSSIAFTYSSHFLEHLLPQDALNLLKEIRRTLTPTGRARIVVPSFEYALEIYSGKAHETWPRNFQAPSAQAINYLFCDGQHAYAYSMELLEECTKQAAFSEIVHREIIRPGTVQAATNYPVELPAEPVGSLVVELKK